MDPLLDHAALSSLIQAAGRELTGEWLLVGGGAAALWFNASRRTEDVDLIGLLGTGAERLALMELALAHGLAVETVNSAADFFVRRIPDWREGLEPLHLGPSATIYRPSPTLFLLLKIGRLSEKDGKDCEDLLRFVPRANVDSSRVIAAIAALPPVEDESLTVRREALVRLLGG